MTTQTPATVEIEKLLRIRRGGVFLQILSPTPGPKEKRRILTESTPALWIHGHLGKITGAVLLTHETKQTLSKKYMFLQQQIRTGSDWRFSKMLRIRTGSDSIFSVRIGLGLKIFTVHSSLLCSCFFVLHKFWKWSLRNPRAALKSVLNR